MRDRESRIHILIRFTGVGVQEELPCNKVINRILYVIYEEAVGVAYLAKGLDVCMLNDWVILLYLACVVT